MNRETESTAMRPLAKALTKSLENVRNLLREACLRNNTPNGPLKLKNNELITDMLLESLKIFDRLFAEFELHYVSAMVPVKSTQEYELQEVIGVLFSETLQRALKMKLLTQEMVDDCDPALMFTIPRLAIVSGLLIYPNGPLCIDKSVEDMSEMFRPFRTLLHKIRELLWTLNKKELYMLEKLLCDNEQCSDVKSVSDLGTNKEFDDFVSCFYNDYSLCKDFVSNFYSISSNGGHEAVELNRNMSHILLSKENVTNKKENIQAEPSTSGCIVSNEINHNPTVHHQDRELLEVISKAAEILTRNNGTHPTNLNSPNDSGVSTGNTSLNRSPSIELNDNKSCSCLNNSSKSNVENCHCYTQRNGHKSLKKYSEEINLKAKSKLSNRKKLQYVKQNEISSGDDTSSLGSSDTSSCSSACADDEEIALAMQAAEIANRNEVRSKFRLVLMFAVF